METTFKYTEEQLNILKAKDRTLASLIDEIGFIERKINTDVFRELIHSIVSQLISRKTATKVFNNISVSIGITPQSLATVDLLELKSFGISLKKAENIQSISKKVLDGTLQIDKFKYMTNKEITDELLKLSGVGIWTAEMLLMLSLNRMDILSYNDLVIKKSLCKLYGLEKISKKEFSHYKELFSPYGSIASLYLWEYNNFNN